MLIAALDDPAFARALAARLALPTRPVQGGQGCSLAADAVSHGNFGSMCSDTGNYNFAGGGNVGIGTTDPTELLYVNGNSGADEGIYVKNSHTGRAYVGIDAGSDSGSLSSLRFYKQGTLAWNMEANASEFLLYDQASATYRLFVAQGTGNVGMGTTTPQSKLDIAGGVAIGSYAGANAAPANGLIASGNVGIGTTAPTQALTLGQGLNAATLMATPAAPTSLTGQNNTGGSLTPVTPYYYKITALDPNGGQTLAGAEASLTLPTGDNSILVAWNAVPGASQYRVWRGTGPGGENSYNVATGTSYTDLGGGTSASLPTTNTALALELAASGVSWFPYQPCVVPGGGFGILPEGQPNPATVLYRSAQGASPVPYEGEDVTILRTYRNAYYRYANPSDPQPDKYTVLTLWAPKETGTSPPDGDPFPSPDREATLTLKRATDDDSYSEFLDLYNNYYPSVSSTQYGIRIQKRNPQGQTVYAQYRDFVFDQWDGVQPQPTTIMVLKANTNVGVGTSSPSLQFQVAKAMSAGVNAVPSSATPTFDASLGNTQTITLTGNVTSSTLSNAVAGQWLVFDIIQDSAGAHAFAWPTNVKGGGIVNGGANKHNVQMFYFDGTSAWAVAPMESN